MKTYTVGQPVWLRCDDADGITYKEGTVTSISTMGTVIRVAYVGGDTISYPVSKWNLPLSAEEKARSLESDRMRAVRQRTQAALVDASTGFEDALNRLRCAVQGDRRVNPDYIRRLGDAARQLDAITSSLLAGSPAATNERKATE